MTATGGGEGVAPIGLAVAPMALAEATHNPTNTTLHPLALAEATHNPTNTTLHPQGAEVPEAEVFTLLEVVVVAVPGTLPAPSVALTVIP